MACRTYHRQREGRSTCKGVKHTSSKNSLPIGIRSQEEDTIKSLADLPICVSPSRGRYPALCVLLKASSETRSRVTYTYVSPWNHAFSRSIACFLAREQIFIERIHSRCGPNPKICCCSFMSDNVSLSLALACDI